MGAHAKLELSLCDGVGELQLGIVKVVTDAPDRVIVGLLHILVHCTRLFVWCTSVGVSKGFEEESGEGGVLEGGVSNVMVWRAVKKQIKGD